MRKHMSKTTITSLLLSLMLAMGLILTSCGGPANLEEMVNSDEDLKAQIESFSTSGMTIDIKENTVIYTYKYNQVFDEAMAAEMGTQLESGIDSMSSTFNSVKQQLIDESGFDDITLKIIYTDGNDTELYSTEF